MLRMKIDQRSVEKEKESDKQKRINFSSTLPLSCTYFITPTHMSTEIKFYDLFIACLSTHIFHIDSKSRYNNQIQCN